MTAAHEKAESAGRPWLEVAGIPRVVVEQTHTRSIRVT